MTTTIERVLAIREQRDADAKREAADERDRLMHELNSLALDDPDKHAERIADLMFELGLSPNDFERIMDAIIRGRRLSGLALCRDAATVSARKAFGEYTCVKVASEQRTSLAKKASDEARNHASNCADATKQLQELRDEFPLLFTEIDGVPICHGDIASELADAAERDRERRRLVSTQRRLDSEIRRGEAMASMDKPEAQHWRGWLTECRRELKRVTKQIEALDDAPADASTDADDADADE